MRDNIGDNMRDNIRDNMRDNIRDNMRDNIRDNMRDNIRDNMRDNIRDNILSSNCHNDPVQLGEVSDAWHFYGYKGINYTEKYGETRKGKGCVITGAPRGNLV
jgi:hypothetical protein